ncbi:hypothetical protein [Candidatus Corynebacterium faecigallinarum]|uniref:hypothetical protein n=1 Tax=Candidatus Corynebacterium faecigallinarum TaxID=2838528 RepID=UPI003FD1E771
MDPYVYNAIIRIDGGISNLNRNLVDQLNASNKNLRHTTTMMQDMCKTMSKMMETQNQMLKVLREIRHDQPPRKKELARKGPKKPGPEQPRAADISAASAFGSEMEGISQVESVSQVEGIAPMEGRRYPDITESLRDEWGISEN